MLPSASFSADLPSTNFCGAGTGQGVGDVKSLLSPDADAGAGLPVVDGATVSDGDTTTPDGDTAAGPVESGPLGAVVVAGGCGGLVDGTGALESGRKLDATDAIRPFDAHPVTEPAATKPAVTIAASAAFPCARTT